MDNISHIFKKNKEEIKKYLFETIDKINTQEIQKGNISMAFDSIKSLKSVFISDLNYNQISPLYSEKGIDNSRVNTIRNSLKENIKLDKDGKYISSAYLCSSDSIPTITISKKIDNDKLIVFNFNLPKLLGDLKYTSQAKFFGFMSKFLYGAIGYSLSFFAFILFIYSLYNFAYHSYIGDVNVFRLIFKSTIALTLGLAIFDLAKNLLEHEVIYKEQFSEEHGSSKLLEKFLISIIIALSIESLMTVFKIALTNYKDILYAVYLIIATSIMILALSYFKKR